MNRENIENILRSMRTTKNGEKVDIMLEKINDMSDTALENITTKIGNTEETIKSFLAEKLTELAHNRTNEHVKINEFFSYGVNGKCVHLHLPMNLHELISEVGTLKAIDTVNLYLLDAIDKIKDLRDSGDEKIKGIESIYMVSPILLKRELKFLSDIDFKTKIYSKEELNSDEIEKDKEKMLIIDIFEKDKNIGTASIGWNIVDSKRWQEKKKQKMQELGDYRKKEKNNNFISELKKLTYNNPEIKQSNVQTLDEQDRVI